MRTLKLIIKSKSRSSSTVMISRFKNISRGYAKRRRMPRSRRPSLLKVSWKHILASVTRARSLRRSCMLSVTSWTSLLITLPGLTFWRPCLTPRWICYSAWFSTCLTTTKIGLCARSTSLHWWNFTKMTMKSSSILSRTISARSLRLSIRSKKWRRSRTLRLSRSSKILRIGWRSWS